MDEIGDQVWDGFAEECAVHMYEEGEMFEAVPV